MDWTQAPDQYGAIHFHDDDLVDAGWQEDFALELPAGLRSGVYAARLSANEAEFYVPFFVRPPRGQARAAIAYPRVDRHLHRLHQQPRPLRLARDRALPRPADGAGRDRPVCCSSIPRSASRPTIAIRTAAASPTPRAIARSPTSSPSGRHWNFNLDLFIVDWLEHLGVDYDVITEEDLHDEGLDLLRPYRGRPDRHAPGIRFARDARCAGRLSAPGRPADVHGRQRLLLADRAPPDAGAA